MTPEARIAETLAQHAYYYDDSHDRAICRGSECDWSDTDSRRPDLAHAAHQAAVLANHPNIAIVEQTDSDTSPLYEARMWARHGYELGQRSATWSDQGVAPKWLTANCAVGDGT